jgi:hypothetical protein
MTGKISPLETGLLGDGGSRSRWGNLPTDSAGGLRAADRHPDATRPQWLSGKGAPQDSPEFGDLPLGHVSRQDGLRPVEGSGPLMKLDRDPGLE